MKRFKYVMHITDVLNVIKDFNTGHVGKTCIITSSTKIQKYFMTLLDQSAFKKLEDETPAKCVIDDVSFTHTAPMDKYVCKRIYAGTEDVYEGTEEMVVYKVIDAENVDFVLLELMAIPGEPITKNKAMKTIKNDEKIHERHTLIYAMYLLVAERCKQTMENYIVSYPEFGIAKMIFNLRKWRLDVFKHGLHVYEPYVFMERDLLDTATALIIKMSKSKLRHTEDFKKYVMHYLLQYDYSKLMGEVKPYTLPPEFEISKGRNGTGYAEDADEKLDESSHDVKTEVLPIGDDVSLVGMSRTDIVLSNDALNSYDINESLLALDNLFIDVSGDVIKINTADYVENFFDGYGLLDFETKNIALDSHTKLADGGELTVLKEILVDGGYSIVLGVKLTGALQEHVAEVRIESSTLYIVTVNDKFGNMIFKSDEVYKKLQTIISNTVVTGYQLSIQLSKTLMSSVKDTGLTFDQVYVGNDKLTFDKVRCYYHGLDNLALSKIMTKVFIGEVNMLTKDNDLNDIDEACDNFIIWRDTITRFDAITGHPQYITPCRYMPSALMIEAVTEALTRINGLPMKVNFKTIHKKTEY